MALSEAQIEMRQTLRENRRQVAEETGVSIAKAAAQDLPPPVANFFQRLRPYVNDETMVVDEAAVENAYPDPDVASKLLKLLEIGDFLETKTGRTLVTGLGKEALHYVGRE